MSGAANGPWLPPGPWLLRRAFVLWRMLLAPVLAVAAVLVVVLGGQRSWRVAAALTAEARIEALSIGSADAQFTGRVGEHGWRGTGLLRRFGGSAVADVDGRRVAAPISFVTVISGRDALPPLRVLYTDAPQALTTTWHVATRRERWVGLALGLLVLGAAALAPAWVAWGMWRRARGAAAIAHDGVEVLAGVDVVPPRGRFARGRWSLLASWEIEGSRHRLRIEHDPRHGGPLSAGGKVVLLVSRRRPDRALVVRQDLWPLRLSADERDGLLRRIAEFDAQLVDADDA